MNSLQDFMISRVRVKLIELFFTQPEELFYVRELTRLAKEEINAVRRELDRLLGAGVLKSEERGNRLYYFVNTQYVYFQEMQRLVAKSTGLGYKLRKLRRKLGQVNFVMFSGKFVENKPSRNDEVDLLVVGEIVLPELEALVADEEKKRGREINYTVLRPDEFEFRKTRRDPFIMELMYGVKVMIIGNEEEFCERKAQGL